MDTDITFCVVHHATIEYHSRVLENCINSIRKFYPNNDIIICKTSTTNVDLNKQPLKKLSFIGGRMKLDNNIYDNIRIFNTLYDGSTIIGGTDCCIRHCRTSKFILLHDSMYFIKEINNSIFNNKLFPLWYFDKEFTPELFDFEVFLKSSNFTANELQALENITSINASNGYGVFGPAFGGNIEELKHIHYKLNINKDTIKNFISHYNLQKLERLFGVLFIYFNYIEKYISLNGDIRKHPKFFINNDMNIQYNTYTSYMCKIWLLRD